MNNKSCPNCRIPTTMNDQKILHFNWNQNSKRCFEDNYCTDINFSKKVVKRLLEIAIPHLNNIQEEKMNCIGKRTPQVNKDQFEHPAQQINHLKKELKIVQCKEIPVIDNLRNSTQKVERYSKIFYKERIKMFMDLDGLDIHLISINDCLSIPKILEGSIEMKRLSQEMISNADARKNTIKFKTAVSKAKDAFLKSSERFSNNLDLLLQCSEEIILERDNIERLIEQEKAISTNIEKLNFLESTTENIESVEDNDLLIRLRNLDTSMIN